MARKAFYPALGDKNQIPLLADDPETGKLVPADSISRETHEGPAVPLYARSGHLLSALGALSTASRLRGFETAAGYTPKIDKIEDRYGDATGTVVDRSIDRATRKENEAKKHFAEAFGLRAMIGSGLIGEGDAKRMASEFYERFIDKYAGSKGSQRRENYKKALNRNRKIAAGEKVRKAPKRSA